tara:strand:- start:65 stop:343 length:279 start_codon:yes stop_codon:yes gene_type:complete
MDRYVRKSDISHFGLESLGADELIQNNIDRKKDDYDIKLQQFKKYMTNKLYKFDPVNSKGSDKLLQLLWLSFFFNDISPEKQQKLYTNVENL